MKEFSKSVNSWWSYCRKFDTTFFETQCIITEDKYRVSFTKQTSIATKQILIGDGVHWRLMRRVWCSHQRAVFMTCVCRYDVACREVITLGTPLIQLTAVCVNERLDDAAAAPRLARPRAHCDWEKRWQCVLLLLLTSQPPAAAAAAAAEIESMIA